MHLNQENCRHTTWQRQAEHSTLYLYFHHVFWEHTFVCVCFDVSQTLFLKPNGEKYSLNTFWGREGNHGDAFSPQAQNAHLKCSILFISSQNIAPEVLIGSPWICFMLGVASYRKTEMRGFEFTLLLLVKCRLEASLCLNHSHPCFGCVVLDVCADSHQGSILCFCQSERHFGVSPKIQEERSVQYVLTCSWKLKKECCWTLIVE